MQRKSFVSLSFSRQKLQVIKLNSGRTKVEKFATVDLPPGIITNNQVSNLGALTLVIKNTWKQLKLGEKTVGLIIPEFSSFVKPITLPKLEIGDLDEAVRWQAQEFLPSGTSDMVMDWKIVEEGPDKYKILTVSMKKVVLAGYVDAVSEAGLFPLLVKTPAIALANLCEQEPAGKLIVYSNLGETILVMAEGKNILGSSVVNLEDKVDMALTASQIVKHYKDVLVKKIFVGGGDITQSHIGALQKTLGKPVEIIKCNVHGIPPEQVQKYLTPVSLGQASHAGPSDETTVNLLPSKWVKTYQNKRLNSQIWGLLSVSTLILLVCLVVTVGAYFYLDNQAKTLKKENAAQSSGLPKELTDKITEINETSARVLSISQVAKTPQEVINAINKVKPPEVSISGYNLDLDKGNVSFGGIAQTRESLVKFKEGLSENPDFGSVSIPLSSFELEVDLPYQISFIYIPASKKAGSTPKIPQNVEKPNPGI